MYKFSAAIAIIGINPFVFVPADILLEIFKQAGKDNGPVPITGTINGKLYKQTLVKYSGEWRLYINTFMLKKSPERIGEIIDITIQFDPESREIKPPAGFISALNKNKKAKAVFDSLPAHRKTEIARYLANLKTAGSLQKNIIKAINFLPGNEKFPGREKP